jgi:hypothetical protein
MKCLLHVIFRISLLLLAGSVAAQEAASPVLTQLIGNYTLKGNPNDSATTIKNAIDAATAQMGMFSKGVARDRLAAVNKVITRLTITRAQQNITIKMNDYVITVPLDGSSVELKTPAGELAKTAINSSTATLTQYIVSSKALRENRFRLLSDGHLEMQVHETSPQLPTALSYRLNFARVGP